MRNFIVLFALVASLILPLSQAQSAEKGKDVTGEIKEKVDRYHKLVLDGSAGKRYVQMTKEMEVVEATRTGDKLVIEIVVKRVMQESEFVNLDGLVECKYAPREFRTGSFQVQTSAHKQKFIRRGFLTLTIPSVKAVEKPVTEKK